jgi:hypothetical protein
MIVRHELYSKSSVRNFYVVVFDFVVLKSIHFRKRHIIIVTKYEFGELEYIKFLKFFFSQILLERQRCKECPGSFGLSAIECCFRFTAHRFTAMCDFFDTPRAIFLAGGIVRLNGSFAQQPPLVDLDTLRHIDEA